MARDPMYRPWRKGNRTWSQFERCVTTSNPAMSDEDLAQRVAYERSGVLELWRNNLYQVSVNHAPLLPHSTTSWPPLFWLSIRRVIRCAIPRDWRDLQRIKNEIAGPNREAVELFPNEGRLTDESDQFHLWVLCEEGLRFPFGYPTRTVRGPDTDEGRTHAGGSQRPFEFEDYCEPVARCSRCARLSEHCSCGGGA